MRAKQTNLLFLLLVLLLGFHWEHPSGPGGIGFVSADDDTEEPTEEPSGSGDNKLGKCYKDVRDSCNCGLVFDKGSRCVQNIIRQICRPKKEDRQMFKRRIRKRYKQWCRKIKKKGRNFRKNYNN